MRWLLRIATGLAVLVIAVVAVISLIPSERVAALAASEFQRLFGRELQITGEVKTRLWPVLGVETGPVTIANADWSDADAPMFTAEKLVIGVNAASLLGGAVQIETIEVTRPALVLEQARDGRQNWVFGGGGSGGEVTTDTPGIGTPYTLEQLLVTGGSLRVIDWRKKTDVTYDGIDLTLRVPDYSGPFTVQASGIAGGQRVSLTAEGGLWSAFTEGRVVPLTAKAGVGRATADFSGSAGWQPMAAEGELTADLSDIPALAAALGSDVTAPPRGMGAENLRLSGKLTLTANGTAALTGATIVADGNTLTGNLELSPGEARPKLSAQLSTGALSLTGLSGGEGGGADGGMQAEGWPTGVMDVSALGTVDAAVALVAESIDLGVVKFGETQLMLTVDRARAVFDIRRMAAYGGSVAGEFVVNGRGGLSVGGKLTLANLGIQPLMQDLAGWDRLVSTGNLTLSFLGVGNSVDAIMKSLKGEGNFSLGKGELRGLDIAGMLRTLDTSFVGEGQKTIFDGVAGSFAIADGVLSNSDLKFVAPYLTATGAGKVGLGARNLDYRIRPTAFPGEDGTGGVMVPLWITGSWAKPTYRLDLESIAREKMEAEAKAAEARAKAELEAKLKEEAGIEARPGESLEDAAKRRAEEVLTEEAAKLLEGILGGN